MLGMVGLWACGNTTSEEPQEIVNAEENMFSEDSAEDIAVTQVSENAEEILQEDIPNVESEENNETEAYGGILGLRFFNHFKNG